MLPMVQVGDNGERNKKPNLKIGLFGISMKPTEASPKRIGVNKKTEASPNLQTPVLFWLP